MTSLTLSIAALLLISLPALAQRPGGGRGGDLPFKAGDSLPEASGVDAQGKPFHLKDLKGSHAVLVFGCLT